MMDSPDGKAKAEVSPELIYDVVVWYGLGAIEEEPEWEEEERYKPRQKSHRKPARSVRGIKVYAKRK